MRYWRFRSCCSLWDAPPTIGTPPVTVMAAPARRATGPSCRQPNRLRCPRPRRPRLPRAGRAANVRVRFPCPRLPRNSRRAPQCPGRNRLQLPRRFFKRLGRRPRRGRPALGGNRRRSGSPAEWLWRRPCRRARRWASASTISSPKEGRIRRRGTCGSSNRPRAPPPRWTCGCKSAARCRHSSSSYALNTGLSSRTSKTATEADFRGPSPFDERDSCTGHQSGANRESDRRRQRNAVRVKSAPQMCEQLLPGHGVAERRGPKSRHSWSERAAPRPSYSRPPRPTSTCVLSPVGIKLGARVCV